MDLLQQVIANLEIDEGKAERGVGAILMSLRVLVDKETFERVKQAVPGAESYMGRSLMSASRTGEMAAMVGPKALLAGLAAAGFEQDDIPRLGRLVLEHLRPTIGPANVDKFFSMAPALKS
ncbi:MAG: DUF2780 domain-containing protein [Gemmatimonadales bacterium]